MKKLFLKGLFSLIAFSTILQAEVEEITIRWNAMTCLDACIPRLESYLKEIKYISNLQINARSGAAVMGWSPNAPFSFEPFRLASGGAGVYFNDMRLRVRGTIAHDADNFYLVSTGDETHFLIIGPIHVEPGRYVPPYNLASHPLSAQTKAKLFEAEQNNQTVVISGPLYLPQQYPRILIAAQIRVQNKESQMDARYRRD